LVSGGDPLGIFESPLDFRLIFVAGDGGAWIDFFRFDSYAATENESWGSIKSLFR